MLRVEIKEIRNYLSNFCSSKELASVFYSVISKQFELYIATMEKEKEINPTIYKDVLFEKTCDTIIGSLSEMGLRKEARTMQDRIMRMK